MMIVMHMIATIYTEKAVQIGHKTEESHGHNTAAMALNSLQST